MTIAGKPTVPSDNANLRGPSQFIDLARNLNAPAPDVKIWRDVQIHYYRLAAGEWAHGPIADLRLSIQLGGSVMIKRRLQSRWQEDIRAGGQISLTPPEEAASWAWQSSQETALLFLSSRLIDELVEDAGLVRGKVRFRAPLAENDPMLGYFARLLLGVQDGQQAAHNLWLETAARFLGAHIISRYSESAVTFRRGGLSDTQIKKITGFVQENLAGDVTLSTLADIASISRAHFCKAFKTSLGITPHRYVLECRLKRAQEAMQSTANCLAMIAADHGFSSEQHFCSAFKRKFGMTPGAWRKRVRT